jgi:hypothetical protein
VPALAGTVTLPPPKARTHKAQQKSANRTVTILARPKVHGEGKQNAADLQRQTMKGPNHFTELFGTDCTRQNIIDGAHQIANTIQDTFCLIRHTKGTCYIGTKRKTFTHFMGLTQPRKRPPWEASKKACKWVDDVVVPAVRIRLPSVWPGINPKGVSALTTSQRMLLAGDLGKYFLQFYDIHTDYKDMFADLFSCLERLMRYKHTSATLLELERDMQAVLAWCEHTLPPVWCSGVKHYNLHLCDFIRRCGPFQDHNMLAFERWHTIFKRLARGRKNILASIHNHWSMVLASAKWRVASQGGDEWTTKGFDSSLAGAQEVDYTLRAVLAKGKRTKLQIALSEFGQIQDQWAIYDPHYDQ